MLAKAESCQKIIEFNRGLVVFLEEMGSYLATKYPLDEVTEMEKFMDQHSATGVEEKALRKLGGKE